MDYDDEKSVAVAVKKLCECPPDSEKRKPKRDLTVAKRLIARNLSLPTDVFD